VGHRSPLQTGWDEAQHLMGWRRPSVGVTQIRDGDIDFLVCRPTKKGVQAGAEVDGCCAQTVALASR